MRYLFLGRWGRVLLFVVGLSVGASPVSSADGWLCGDVDVSQAVDIGDLTYLVDFLFMSGPPPQPYSCRGDWNGDAIVDISDLSATVDFLFFLGTPPPLACCPNCDVGFANCDGLDSNGCEVSFNSSGSCSQFQYGGSYYFEDASCTETSLNFAQRGELYLRIFSLDCDAFCLPFSPEDFGMRISLAVPVGIDYDLYLRGSTCGILASSLNGTGQSEQIIYAWEGQCGLDDGQYFFIEIRYHSGTSCANWALHVQRYP